MAQISVEQEPVPKRKNESLLIRFAKQWDIQLMVLPALALVFVFSYIPMYGILMAFQDFNIFKGWATARGPDSSISKCF